MNTGVQVVLFGTVGGDYGKAGEEKRMKESE
jgi:hypothetical protein